MMITKIRTSLLALLIAASLSACGDDEPALEEAVAAADEEHTDEEADVVVLDSMAIATGGIMVTPVETVQTTGIPVTGTITYDARRVSHIGPRIDGRIVRLVADIGDQVSAGGTRG